MTTLIASQCACVLLLRSCQWWRIFSLTAAGSLWPGCCRRRLKRRKSIKRWTTLSLFADFAWLCSRHQQKDRNLSFSLWLQQTKEKNTVKVQADDPISFLQLINKADLGAGEVRCWTSLVMSLCTSRVTGDSAFFQFYLIWTLLAESVWADPVTGARNDRQKRGRPDGVLKIEQGKKPRSIDGTEMNVWDFVFLWQSDSLFLYLFFQVTQLTGFSDPVYAEAYVHVNQYDIVLDVLIVNQTSDTLQNLTLELATLGEKCAVSEECGERISKDFTFTLLRCSLYRWPEVGGETATSHDGSTWLHKYQSERKGGFYRKRHYLRKHRWAGCFRTSTVSTRPTRHFRSHW